MDIHSKRFCGFVTWNHTINGYSDMENEQQPNPNSQHEYQTQKDKGMNKQKKEKEKQRKKNTNKKYAKRALTDTFIPCIKLYCMPWLLAWYVCRSYEWRENERKDVNTAHTGREKKKSKKKKTHSKIFIAKWSASILIAIVTNVCEWAKEQTKCTEVDAKKKVHISFVGILRKLGI